MKEKYGKIMGVETEFDSYQATIQQAGSYRAEVQKVQKELFADNKPLELTFKVGDDTYTYNVKPEVGQPIIEEFLSTTGFKSFGQSAESLKGLKAIIESTIRQKEFDNILREVAVSARDKGKLEAQAGRQGVISQDTLQTENASKGGNDIVSQVSKEVTSK